MFKAQLSYKRFKPSKKVDPAALFDLIDSEQEGQLDVSDLEAFVMPNLRQILHLKDAAYQTGELSLSELTHNIANYLISAADLNNDGLIEKWEM